jgi:hypothetical protein
MNNPPRWLNEIKYLLGGDPLNNLTSELLKFNLKQILDESCFYLSAGADITPIVAFKKIIYSYILCDLYLYDSIKGIENKFNGILVKLKDRLINQGFTEIQKIYLDEEFLGINEWRYRNGYISKMGKCEMSIWENEGNIYSIIYINHDNILTYKSLYVKNNIIPKGICEILSEGGSLIVETSNLHGGPTLTLEEINSILPEYVLGHTYSIGDIKLYEKLPINIEYFGDYGPQYGSNSAMQLHKRK